MDRAGASALCRTAVSANVSLSARAYQRVSQADAAERLYLAFAKLVNANFTYRYFYIAVHSICYRLRSFRAFLTAFLTIRVCLFAEKGLDHVAESILSYLDAKSLVSAELVCKEWHRVISEGMLWKKLIERKVRTDSVWRGLAERRGW